MNDLFHGAAKAHLSQNELHLYYRIAAFDIAAGPALTLGDIVGQAVSSKTGAAPVFTPATLAALSGRYSENGVWQLMDGASGSPGRWTVGQDLVAPIRSLLSGQQPKLATQWGLSEAARKILNGEGLFEQGVPKPERQPVYLSLFLRKSGNTRLLRAGIDPVPLRLEVENLSLAGFATGHCFCVARVRVNRSDDAPLSAMELTEAVYALARANICRWTPAGGSGGEAEASKASGFSFGEFIRIMAEGSPGAETTGQRVTTYCFAQFQEHLPSEKLDLIGSYLSRRYTSDYVLDHESGAISPVSDFKNIRHFATIEGVSTVLAPRTDGSLAEFQQSWISNSMRTTYSHLVLLSLHEHEFLDQSRVVTAQDVKDDSALPFFSAAIDRSILFRMYFCFTIVSGLYAHNSFASSFRQGLHLDQRLADTESELRAMSDRLVSASQQREEIEQAERHRRYYGLTLVGSSGIAALTAYTIFSEFTKIILLSSTRPLPLSLFFEQLFGESNSNASDASSFALVGGIVVFFVSLGVGSRFWPKKPTPIVADRISIKNMR